MAKKKIIHDGVEIEVDESHPLFPVPIDSDTKAKWAEDGARAMRNGLLASTDWWGVSDRNMSDEEKKYRSDLRDLPTHSSWPNLKDSDWPTKPS